MSLAPSIPYVQIPELTIVPADFFGGGFPPAPFSIKPFGTLVAAGVYLGGWLSVRQSRRVGLDEKVLMSFIFWVVGCGFVFGHVLDTLWYYPGRVLESPMSLVRLWDGLSSFGGFVGAAIGTFLFRWRYGIPILPYADTIGSAFPAAWVLGRAGCSVAHDHPGLVSDLWIAVQYPSGGRLDLGFCEMLATIPLAVTFLVLRRRPRPWGFYLATMWLAYAPTRFALDYLRIDRAIVEGAHVIGADPRYGGLTPAQWASILMLGAGIWMFLRVLRGAGTAEAVGIPTPSDET